MIAVLAMGIPLAMILALKVSTTQASAPVPHRVEAVIRFTPVGWVALNNRGHKPVGVSKVYCNPKSGSVIVRFSTSFTRIYSSAITVDETYVVKGIAAGGSVGFRYVGIRLAKNGRFVRCTDWNRLMYARSNIWVMITGEV